eukprot:CAMPEP_0194205692 /NCGR_PEP_ID=MMETSP0156-20130528/4913_1 /TAXON_ID=33649 /ORGANISM="Thalassionema nitzschioides, Strain L26-B" /LENGTH=227 /DNA_ID=CAMNT_0038932043 /DNA_START=158 /DNA_END=841 /DNA_ORIENTATION=-
MITTTIEFAYGFAAAAKNNKNNKNRKKTGGAASTRKGFAAPPPTLEDLLSSFRTRLPQGDANNTPCPCGSSEVYGDCCGPLHRGERRCTTMTDVLRSRYSAFSFRNIQYIMDTTHPTCRDHRNDRIAWAKDLNKAGMFDSFEFAKLEIIDGPEEKNDIENENEGYVTFKVTLVAREDSVERGILAGQETVITERSKFLRDAKDNSWSYASGDVRSDVAGLEETTLNG